MQCDFGLSNENCNREDTRFMNFDCPDEKKTMQWLCLSSFNQNYKKILDTSHVFEVVFVPDDL